MIKISAAVAATSLILLGSYVNAQDDNDFSLSGVMVTAKFTGGCGIIKQMSQFQQDTQMPGGDEFIVRFLKTEATRLGFTLEAYMQHCVDQSKIYQAWFEIAEEMDAE